MRYLTPLYIYLIWETLRDAYKGRVEGPTFSPEWPKSEVMARLEAAAGRPRQSYSGQEAHATLFAKTAALGHAISGGHCFGNGNKRTAFIAMSSMLQWNGWFLMMPPGVTSFMMLRSATSGGMTTEEMADFIASYAIVMTDPNDIKTGLYTGEGQVRVGLLEEDGSPEFPVRPPSIARKVFAERMLVAYHRNKALLNPHEEAELVASELWPLQTLKILTKWGHIQEHRLKAQRKIGRRTRSKRIGKRRCPQKGGRTVPKIPRPITQRHLGLHNKA